MHIKDRDITLYIEKSISEEKKRDMEQHFSICEICRRKLDEWKRVYNTIDLLEFHFQLDGFEEKVMKEIKKKEEEAGRFTCFPQFTFPKVIFCFILLVGTSLLFSPVSNLFEWLSGYTARFIFNEGLNWIQKMKWPAMNMIYSIRASDIIGWFLPIVSAVLLIAGGTSFFFGSKRIKKVSG